MDAFAVGGGAAVDSYKALCTSLFKRRNVLFRLVFWISKDMNERQTALKIFRSIIFDKLNYRRFVLKAISKRSRIPGRAGSSVRGFVSIASSLLSARSKTAMFVSVLNREG